MRAWLWPLFLALRPRQWVKNLVVFVPLVLTGHLFDPAGLIRALAVCLGFCLLSGSVYLLNDMIDKNQDCVHPVKRHRPIASGKLPVSVAAWAAGGLAAGCVGLGAAIEPLLAPLLFAYIGYNLLYSLFLKQVIIVDVVVIALGFVIRLMAGSVMLGVVPSMGMLSLTFTGALFLGFGKRRAELAAHRATGATARPVLDQYSETQLDALLTTLLAIISPLYCLLTIVEAPVSSPAGCLVSTVVFVLYGLFRYRSLIRSRAPAQDPVDLLYTDRPLQSCLLLWGIAVVWGIYRP